MAISGIDTAWEQRMPGGDTQNLEPEKRSRGHRLFSQNLRTEILNLPIWRLWFPSTMTSPRRSHRRKVKLGHSGPTFTSTATIAGKAPFWKTPGQAVDIARKTVEAARGARNEYAVGGQVHLFMAVPAGLAMLIGQLLNTLGPIQTYEHIPSNPIGSICAGSLDQ